MPRKSKKSTPVKLTREVKKLLLCLVKYYYDLQRLRIQTGGRIRALKVYLTGDSLNWLESQEEFLTKCEKDTLEYITSMLSGEPVYEWLLSIKGIGHKMAAVMRATFDFERCDTVSAMWAYCGLGKERLWEVTYIDPSKKGKAKKQQILTKIWASSPDNAKAFILPEERMKFDKLAEWRNNLQVVGCTPISDFERQRIRKGFSVSYNTWLKSKLLDGFGITGVKTGSPYKKIYDDRKNRTRSAKWGSCDMHRHRDAVRVMTKEFLKDFYKVGREAEGLPVRPPYAEEFLNKKHSGIPVWDTTISTPYDCPEDPEWAGDA